jgi:hypothetical protein
MALERAQSSNTYGRALAAGTVGLGCEARENGRLVLLFALGLGLYPRREVVPAL